MSEQTEYERLQERLRLMNYIWWVNRTAREEKIRKEKKT